MRRDRFSRKDWGTLDLGRLGLFVDWQAPVAPAPDPDPDPDHETEGDFPDIREIVTGDLTGNVQTVDTLDVTAPTGFVTLLGSPASNRTIEISPETIGVHEWSAKRGGIKIPGSNLTIVGHKRAIVGKNVPLRTENSASNIIFRDLAMRVGLDEPGADIPDRDAMQAWFGTNFIFENCSFTWGIDELVQLGPKWIGDNVPTENVLFRYCLFAEPLYAPLRPDEANDIHPYGPLVTGKLKNVVFDRCAILGCVQRSPSLTGVVGCLVQNCVIAYGGNSGINVGHSFEQQQNSIIVRNTLMRPAHSWSERGKAFKASGASAEPGVLSRAYVDTPTVHFIGNANGFDFADDPIDPRVYGFTNAGGSMDVFVDTPPFTPHPNWHPLPTGTPAEREAMFHYVMDRVGVRDRDASGEVIPGDAAASVIDARIIGNFRNGVNFTGTGTKPANGGLSRPEYPDDVGGYVF